MLDLEDDGWAKRIAAESEAARQLRCSVSAVQKALGQYEDMLKAMRPEDVEWVRSFRI